MTLGAIAFVFFALVLPIGTAWYALDVIHRYKQLPPNVRRYLDATVEVPMGIGHLLLGICGGFLIASALNAPILWILYSAWGFVCHAAIGPVYRLEAWEKAKALSEGISAPDEMPHLAPAPPAPLAGRTAMPEDRR